MADTEFEEFTHNFDKVSLHTNNSSTFYSLVHDVVVDEEESPTSSIKSDPETDCDIVDGQQQGTKSADVQDSSCGANGSGGSTQGSIWTGERRRRKLPEIPNKYKTSSVATMYNPAQYHHHQISARELSLADELGGGSGIAGICNQSTSNGINVNGSTSSSSILVLKCGYLWDDTDSPDSDRVLNDADSGHSTAHSPTGTEGFKSMSPIMGMSGTSAGVVYSDVEMLEATHRGLHKFVPRHEDEIDVEIGDPIYVQKEADDLWSEGVNLRTGRMGIFPSAYAVDCDYTDWDSSTEHGRRERYLLGYLGSVETLAHKGTSVVCQAVRRVIGNHGIAEPDSQPCILEVSDQGLRMVDRRKRNQNDPCIDYFYSLKNVSFCAFHPRDHRYLGFITKHPTLQRFACHVFRGTDSTRPVAEAVGRAFQRFYQKFIETAYPVEDIYIE